MGPNDTDEAESGKPKPASVAVCAAGWDALDPKAKWSWEVPPVRVNSVQ